MKYQFNGILHELNDELIATVSLTTALLVREVGPRVAGLVLLASANALMEEEVMKKGETMYLNHKLMTSAKVKWEDE